MNLGIGSYTYTWAIGVPGALPPERPMTAPGLLGRAKELGVHLVQFADNLSLDRLSRAELDGLADQANQMRIAIEVGTRGIDPTHVRRFLKIASFLQSPILRVVVDTTTFHPTPSEVIELLSPLRPEFKDAGIQLAIENHDRFACKTLAHIVRQLGEDWTGICLDTVNSLGALEGPEVVVAGLGPLAINLHVKDFSIARPAHGMGFTVEGRPAGQGRLDVPWLLGELCRFGRDPNAILELWTPAELELAETIAKEDAWVRESLTYLRQFIQE